MKKYCIEIYEPGSKLDVLASFESDSPFLAISKGDTLSDAFFNTNGPEKWLLVSDINHIIWEHEPESGPKHKMLIYTVSI